MPQIRWTPLLYGDPLNFRAANELYLIARESGRPEDARKILADLNLKMRDFDQNYLELAVGYLNEGMLAEAEDILARFSGENPIVAYYRGFISGKMGNVDAEGKYYAHAQELSEAGCFPFRLETVEVLKAALAFNEKDTKAHYYIGNILYDKQPEKAIEHWEKSIGNNPELAMAYRNLGWGYYRHYKHLQKAIAWYEKAIEHDNTDPIFYTELDQLYELNNSPVSARLKLFEGNQDVVAKRDDAFERQITVLTLAGKPEKSVQFLEGRQFSYREGTSRVRETIINAYLTYGMKYMEEKNYEKALEQFLLAQVPDEEAGSARYGNRDIQVYYFIARAYEAMKSSRKAREYYNRATSIDRSGSPGIMSYYLGMSYLKLNDKSRADQVFRAMVSSGDDLVNNRNQGEFFAIFGEREAESTARSNAFTLRGLGYKGLGESEKATDDLQKAVDYSVSNLWAAVELGR
jgi:tetratricopeptide (TPR) repeat protein